MRCRGMMPYMIRDRYICIAYDTYFKYVSRTIRARACVHVGFDTIVYPIPTALAARARGRARRRARRPSAARRAGVLLCSEADERGVEHDGQRRTAGSWLRDAGVPGCPASGCPGQAAIALHPAVTVRFRQRACLLLTAYGGRIVKPLRGKLCCCAEIFTTSNPHRLVCSY